MNCYASRILTVFVLLYSVFAISSVWGEDTPPVRNSAGIAQSKEGLFLFGGEGSAVIRISYSLLSDGWSWNGTNWNLVSFTNGPSKRAFHDMAYDAVRDRVVMFGGGISDTQYTNETWEWDGTAWERKTPAITPSAQGYSGMTYDPERNETVLFGGYKGGGVNSNETWGWNGTNWVKKNPSAQPSARHFHKIAYEASKKQMVLFGGTANGTDGMNDTWVWDGINWEKKSPAHVPPARSLFGMVTLGSRGGVLLFGGRRGSSTYLNDFWIWDGEDWTEIQVENKPSPRILFSMAYDAVHDQIVIFGGSDGNVSFNDTWFYDPSVFRNIVITSSLTVKAKENGILLDGYASKASSVVVPAGDYIVTLKSSTLTNNNAAGDPKPYILVYNGYQTTYREGVYRSLNGIGDSYLVTQSHAGNIEFFFPDAGTLADNGGDAVIEIRNVLTRQIYTANVSATANGFTVPVEQFVPSTYSFQPGHYRVTLINSSLYNNIYDPNGLRNYVLLHSFGAQVGRSDINQFHTLNGIGDFYEFDIDLPIMGRAFFPDMQNINDNGGSATLLIERFDSLNSSPVAVISSGNLFEANHTGGADGIVLDGSASFDPDNDPLTFLWTGPFGNLSGSIVQVGLPLGYSTIRLDVSDGDLTTSDSVLIAVQDTAPPVIACPSDMVYEAQGPDGAMVEYSVAVTDVADPNPAIAYSIPSGTVFPMGETQVTCTAIDQSNNMATCEFTIVVQDTTPPAIECPQDITVEGTSPNGNVIDFSILASDTCDLNPAITSSHASGSVFPMGTTIVILTASDQSGNNASCSFTITVRDTIPPNITCPDDIIVEGTGPEGNTIELSAIATDSCDPNPVLSSSFASGSIFPLGITTVTYFATDSSGNSSNCSFSITVQDTSPPIFECPEDIVVEGSGPNGRMVDFVVSAMDVCDPNPLLTGSHPSGVLFPLGTTTVVYIATDSSGNSSQCSFNITVQDTTPPTFDCPEDIIVEGIGPNGSVVDFLVLASDVCDPNPLLVGSHTSGSIFPLGTTTVTYTAKDSRGNVSTCSFNVTVQDTQPPIITCPSNIVVEGTSPDGAVVEFTVSVVDVCDPNPLISSSHVSGALFPLGTTDVMYTALDRNGNKSECSFTITVQDTQPPVIQCPSDIEIVTANPLGSPVEFAAYANDICDITPDITYSPSQDFVFPLGVTTVTCTAEDDSGNQSSCSFVVRIVTPKENVKDLVQYIRELEPEDVSGNVYSLIVKLENAAVHIESNKKNSVKTAVNVLSAFKNQVNEWIRDGLITEQEGLYLIQEVEITIQALQGN